MAQDDIDELRRRIADLEAENAALRTARLLSRAGDWSGRLPGFDVLGTLILESSRDAIAVLDLDGRTQFVSPGGLVAMDVADAHAVLDSPWLDMWQGSYREMAAEALATARTGGTGRFQGVCKTLADIPKWWDTAISALPGPDGTPAHIVAVGRDITGTVTAEQKLRESEENVRLITDALPILISFLDADRVYRFANRQYESWFGLSADRVIGRTIGEVIPDLYDERRAYVDRAYTGEHVRFEAWHETAAGRRAEDMQYIPRRKADGSIDGIYVLGVDITERKRAEDRLRPLAAIVEQSSDFIGAARLDGRIDFINEGGRALVGGDGPVLTMIDCIAPEDRARFADDVLPGVAAAGSWQGEIRFRQAAGQAARPMLFNIFPVRKADGDVFGYGTIARDLTAIKHAEAIQLALIELGDRLRDLTDETEIGFAAAEIMGRTLRVSRAGYGRIDDVNETIAIARDWTMPGVVSIAGVLHFRDYGSYIEDLKRGIPVIIEDADHDPRTASRAAALDGIAVRSFVNFPIRDHGAFAAIVFLNHAEPRAWLPQEITFVGKVADRTLAAVARVHAEASLRRLAASLEEQVGARTRERDRMWRTTQDLFVICGFDGLYRSVNPAWTEVLGFSEADLGRMRFDALAHPEDIDGVRDAFQQLLKGEIIRDYDMRMRAKDGTYRWISWFCIPDADEFYATGRDITARVELEEQLRQAHKMEAVGQLTGGIAHDFNNLLTGIVGSLDLMQTRIAQGRVDALDRYIQGAMTSANRAAALTHRLLAFSRRQPLDPKPVDANALLRSLEELLRRTMSEATRVVIEEGDGLWLTLCDPNQLESALLNLAINARDAMPDGGALTIETANIRLDRAYASQHTDVTAGPYVRIRVSDTGQGMPPDVIARAFEPFYTTKPIGQGTGLGLSMIYGFARQSEGHVEIASTVGAGTTFDLYLPRYAGEHERAEAADAPAADAHAKAGETVLVVEDEAIVRTLVVETLTELGYHILQAPDGIAGLAILNKRDAIDLLVTDVGLPGLNGRQLFDQARERRPDLKVLFITGYAESAMFPGAHLDDTMQMITKPFTIESLAQRVRDMLVR